MGITYESIGTARLGVFAGPGGVTLTANRDGLASLARLFAAMSELANDDHFHLTPSMQLVRESLSLTVALRSGDTTGE